MAVVEEEVGKEDSAVVPSAEDALTTFSLPHHIYQQVRASRAPNPDQSIAGREARVHGDSDCFHLFRIRQLYPPKWVPETLFLLQVVMPVLQSSSHLACKDGSSGA